MFQQKRSSWRSSWPALALQMAVFKITDLDNLSAQDAAKLYSAAVQVWEEENRRSIFKGTPLEGLTLHTQLDFVHAWAAIGAIFNPTLFYLNGDHKPAKDGCRAKLQHQTHSMVPEAGNWAQVGSEQNALELLSRMCPVIAVAPGEGLAMQGHIPDFGRAGQNIAKRGLAFIYHVYGGLKNFLYRMKGVRRLPEFVTGIGAKWEVPNSGEQGPG